MAVSKTFFKNESQTGAAEENVNDESVNFDSGFYQGSFTETNIPSMPKDSITNSSYISGETHLNVKTKKPNQQSTSVSALHSKDKVPQPEYLDYVQFMPHKLKHDYYEILIICAPKDDKDAAIFQSFLQSLGYRVKIFEIGLLPFEKAQIAYDLTMFFFLYVTAEFCKCDKALYHCHTFLSETLTDASKRWSVVPVYTTSNTKELQLNILLRNLHPIRYYRSDKDINSIRNLMKEKSKELAEREIKLHLDRLAYYIQNKSELIEKSKFSTKSMMENAKGILNKDLLVDTFSKEIMKNSLPVKLARNLNMPDETSVKENNTAVDAARNLTTPKEFYSPDETIVKENNIAVKPTRSLTPPKEIYTTDETLVKEKIVQQDESNINYNLVKPVHSKEIIFPVQNLQENLLTNDDSNMQIDNPASQNYESQSRKTDSSNSKSDPEVDPTATKEIPPQKDRTKSETHIHYHTEIKIKKAENIVIGDKGRIASTNNNEKENEVKKTTEGHIPGICNQRPNMSDFDTHAGKVFVGIFWDMQNCPVPRNKSAADIIKFIRDKFIAVDPNNEEKCFFCITDVRKEHANTLECINNCGADTLHINAGKENSSDFKIIQKIEDFSRDIEAAKAKVVLITSDAGFDIKLADLKKRKYHIILIHRQNMKPGLLHSVDENYFYDELIEELPDQHEILMENEPFLIVYGYQPLTGQKAENFKNILESFFSQWNGKIVSQCDTKFGVIKFESFELAKSAKEYTDGKDPFEENDKIIVCFLEGAPDYIKIDVDKILKKNPGKSKTSGANQSGDRSHTISY